MPKTKKLLFILFHRLLLLLFVFSFTEFQSTHALTVHDIPSFDPGEDCELYYLESAFASNVPESFVVKDIININ